MKKQEEEVVTEVEETVVAEVGFVEEEIVETPAPEGVFVIEEEPVTEVAPQPVEPKPKPKATFIMSGNPSSVRISRH